jgi:hypothetical protein
MQNTLNCSRDQSPAVPLSARVRAPTVTAPMPAPPGNMGSVMRPPVATTRMSPDLGSLSVCLGQTGAEMRLQVGQQRQQQS